VDSGQHAATIGLPLREGARRFEPGELLGVRLGLGQPGGGGDREGSGDVEPGDVVEPGGTEQPTVVAAHGHGPGPGGPGPAACCR
jgi:hypothetical protein